jgi:hypothetical protein
VTVFYDGAGVCPLMLSHDHHRLQRVPSQRLNRTKLALLADFPLQRAVEACVCVFNSPTSALPVGLKVNK